MRDTNTEIRSLCFSLNSLDLSICFFGLDGTYLGGSGNTAPPEELRAAVQNALPQIKEGGQIPGTASMLYLCRLEDTPLLYAVIPETDASFVGPYLDTLLSFIFDGSAERNRSYTRKARTMLTSQLANFGDLSDEPNRVIQTLGYSSSVWRAAILCSIATADDRTSMELLSSVDALENAFYEAVEACPSYHEDDIFGMLSNNQLLIFKTVPSGGLLASREPLDRFLDELTEQFKTRLPGHPIFGIGSAYHSFGSLRTAYQEASFLLTNHAILQSGNSRAFISDHLTEYLSYTYFSNSEIVFRDYNELNGRFPLLTETAAALSRNDSVLAYAGDQLGIHRNTVVQRYQKLTKTLHLDPLHRVSDRFLIRAQLLPRMCALVWNAGVHVQANSIQYRGLVKLSEVLDRVSHGAMRLNIHHISTAGDNQQLLKVISGGSLDLASCGCAVFYQISQDLASLIEQPFLFDSTEEAFELLNKLILPLVTTELRNFSVICPAFWVIGSRHITSRDAPIRKPEDLRGKNIRTMSAGILHQYFQRLGAKPITVIYGELHRALATGLADCQENPYINILGIDLSDVQHYINDMVYYYNISPLFVSRESWNRLTAEQQEYLQRAIQETTGWLVSEQEILNRRSREILEREKGMVIITPTKEEKELWLREANLMRAQHPLQAQLRVLLRAKEVYHAEGSVESALPELLRSISRN